ncbi:carbon-nitrogen hydrolase family protein [Blastococcus xanthinilyticus]|uniref:5-aminopentanamidase n=1 Tax=Blastococcus xanthinilyticus TaxID=1564164 RepID=A0A5S5CYI0_9ACTN|nr:carbon-nitrogen hydrolase family protein [Blastococcus xanthinilyticus]TYP88595.1 5-aminopentanamidase [Blastococcus xanthinilyticus]
MRIALHQCESRPLGVDENLERLGQALASARDDGADLLLTPEMYLTGYAIGADAVGRLAQPRDGEWARAVAELARSSGVAVLYGYPERVGDAVYNAVQLVGADGVPLAGYRKTHLFGSLDREQFSPSDDDSAVVEIGGWRCGMLICYDVEFPETARALALAGVDVVLAPTANMVEFDVVATTLVPARAYENQVYVAYANYAGAEADLEYCGLSCVVGPDGRDLARAGRGEELVVAELDRARLAESRRRAPYLLDRRPELYRTLGGT